MFEDFKEKVGRLQNKNDNEVPLMSTALAPEISEKLRKSGIDPDNVTMPATISRNLRRRWKRLVLNVRYRMGNHDNICQSSQIPP